MSFTENNLDYQTSPLPPGIRERDTASLYADVSFHLSGLLRYALCPCTAVDRGTHGSLAWDEVLKSTTRCRCWRCAKRDKEKESPSPVSRSITDSQGQTPEVESFFKETVTNIM